MRTTLPTNLPGCGQPAAQRIEVYTPVAGQAHGSLDASLYTCATHTDQAVTALHTAGLTPWKVPAPGLMCGTRRCGDGIDFTDPTRARILLPTPGKGDDE